MVKVLRVRLSKEFLNRPTGLLVIGLAQFSENHVNADMDYQHSITCTIQTGNEIIAATSITKNALSRCNATVSEILLTLCGDKAEKPTSASDDDRNCAQWISWFSEITRK